MKIWMPILLVFFAVAASAQSVQADILKIKSGGKIQMDGATLTDVETTMPATPTNAQLITASAIKSYVDAQTGETTQTITVTTPTNNFVFGATARPIKHVYRNGQKQLSNIVVVQLTGTVNFTINLATNEQVSIVF
jgi:hypothetical protein